MIANVNEYQEMFGRISDCVMNAAPCACVACNSCTCACSCRKAVNEFEDGEFEW